jgi:putative transposase
VAERQQVLEVLHAERFWDAAPAGVYATLLDEGVYLASVSTMYRLLRQRGETGDRRRHATHPPRVKPELLATAPNQCWSWDVERHEALPNRAVVKGHRLGLVAASH